MSDRRPAAARFFDAVAGRYERSYALDSTESRRRMERIVRDLPAVPSRVLDLGVGTGRELSALLDAGHSPVGVDFSAAMLERCARRARPVPTVLADFWQPLPFDDASFDAAVALHGTLAHPPDRDAVPRLATELARVVRRGGCWLAEVPSPAWLDEAPEDTGPAGDRRMRRTGPRTCAYEDLVAGVSIDARILDEAEWRAALAPAWSVARLDALGPREWLVVARHL